MVGAGPNASRIQLETPITHGQGVADSEDTIGQQLVTVWSSGTWQW